MPRLKVVGAGTLRRTPNRWGTCFLLGIGTEWVMIDCGPAATYKMYQMDISPSKIEHLFFTHLHADHIADYPCFLMTRFDQLIGTEPELQVHGPQPIKSITDRLWSDDPNALWHDVIARANHPMRLHAYHLRGGNGDRPKPTIAVHEYTESKVAKGNDWACYTKEVKHAQPDLTCFGLRFETKEGIIAFSGDTAPTEAVVELACDADLLIHNVMDLEADLLSSPVSQAMTGAQAAGEIAAAAGAKRLLVNHQSEELEKPDKAAQAITELQAKYDGRVFWAQDFTEIEW